MTDDKTLIRSMPGLPCDVEGPVFQEPWEAQAFAMAIEAHRRHMFTWPEWAAVLSHEIKHAQAQGDPDTGHTYYFHWLRALEKIVIAKGAITDQGLTDLQQAWERAARATPHGEAILLVNDPGH
jgi:nitrile hydratase accessory protein